MLNLTTDGGSSPAAGSALATSVGWEGELIGETCFLLRRTEESAIDRKTGILSVRHLSRNVVQAESRHILQVFVDGVIEEAQPGREYTAIAKATRRLASCSHVPRLFLFPQSPRMTI